MANLHAFDRSPVLSSHFTSKWVAWGINHATFNGNESVCKALSTYGLQSAFYAKHGQKGPRNATRSREAEKPRSPCTDFMLSHKGLPWEALRVAMAVMCWSLWGMLLWPHAFHKFAKDQTYFSVICRVSNPEAKTFETTPNNSKTTQNKASINAKLTLN